MTPIDPSKIKGFLSETEGRRLYELAREGSRIGPCLEIGSYCGKSALYLGRACQENQAVLFSIDHHRGSEEQQPGESYFDPALYDPVFGKIDTSRFFRETLEKADLTDTVVPIVAHSRTAARSWATPLGLVFIDGGHAHDTVLADYSAWSVHIRPGGYLIFHDIFTSPEAGGQAPHQVYRIACQSGLFQEYPMAETLGILKRKGRDLPQTRTPRRTE